MKIDLSCGYSIVDGVVPAGPLALAMRDLSDKLSHGRRNFLGVHPADLLVDTFLKPLAATVLGDGCFPVSATLFAKLPSRNWSVPWHQDLSVPAVVPDLSVRYKDEVPHVQPGAAILSMLLAARLHFDEAGPETGGLWVIPHSHERGVIAEKDIPGAVAERGALSTNPLQGSVMLMRPLILHRSRTMKEKNVRRVLHVLFAPMSLASYPWANARP